MSGPGSRCYRTGTRRRTRSDPAARAAQKKVMPLGVGRCPALKKKHGRQPRGPDRYTVMARGPGSSAVGNLRKKSCPGEFVACYDARNAALISVWPHLGRVTIIDLPPPDGTDAIGEVRCSAAAYIVMAYIVMAFMVMAFVVMAYIVLAYIVMSYIEWAFWLWPLWLGPI